ncbi:MAG TPA: DUF883 family protein [Noviherbaspirillum sp.]|uniref:DUF883 family protein n=1 Tax=Noviherbaspirillum sp. TaxID=1926288 RepID=UPI002F9427E3
MAEGNGNGNGQTGTGRERLLDDLKLVMKDAEQMLRATGQQAGEGYDAARARFETTLGAAQDSLAELEELLGGAAREAIDTTDRYVQQNPWQAVGIGAVAGVLLGMWLGRR